MSNELAALIAGCVVYTLGIGTVFGRLRERIETNISSGWEYMGLKSHAFDFLLAVIWPLSHAMLWTDKRYERVLKRREESLHEYIRSESLRLAVKGSMDIAGKWPGDETDEEIDRALEELS